MLEIGQNAFEISLEDQHGKTINLSDFKGKWIILYFYPKDNTPGCTLEATDFSEAREELEKMNCVIIGLNADSCSSHQKFAQKHNLKIILLSDPDKTILNSYGIIAIKKNYGKESLGIIRTTIIIDPKGLIRYIWKNVKVKGHTEAVINKLRDLQK